MSGSSSASGAESSPQSEGGDTEPLDDDDEDDDIDDPSFSETPPSSQVQVKSWPLAVNQAIVKGVFGRVLNRDDIVNILKKKFSVQPRNLTSLKPTELMSVLVKKLVRDDYCRVKDVVKNIKEDITVLKEIAF